MADNCKHPPCTCKAREGSDYCDDSCQAAHKAGQNDKCVCSHCGA